jgi:hypothetical protein
MSAVHTLTAANDTASLVAARPGDRQDQTEIELALRKYCRDIHTNASTTVAAINWALRQGGDTLSAIRAGRQRAAQLHWRATHLSSNNKA